jgi:hypothetical protein
VRMQDPPHRSRAPLRVRVSFEPNRLAADQLAAAYDQVLPTRRRAVGSCPLVPNPPADAEQATPAKEYA